MQLIVELKSINEINYLKKIPSVKYLLIGIENCSLSSAHEFNLTELELINKKIKDSNFKLMVNLEKIWSEHELNKLELLLEQLEQLNIAFYTYSDVGVYQLLCTKNLKAKTIFRAPTYLVNIADLKLYGELNQYLVLGTEISSQELIELGRCFNQPLIVDLFAKTECFYSRRKLLSRYFEYRNQDNNPCKNTYLIKEELREELQSIIEDETGTHIYDENHHYLLEELENLSNIELGIIHTKFLTIKESRIVVNAYATFLVNQDLDLFIQTLNRTNIKYAKGAYNLQLSLLKKESLNE